MDGRLSANRDFLDAAADAFAARNDPERSQLRGYLSNFSRLDPFARDGANFSLIGVDATDRLIAFASRLLGSEPDLQSLGQGAPELMVVHEGLGVPATPVQLVVSTFSAALEQMYYRGLPENETEYTELVIKNLNALKSASRGRKVTLHEVIGLTGVELPAGRALATPWGQLRGIDRHRYFTEEVGLEGYQRAITLVLCVPRRLKIPIVQPPVIEIPMGPWKSSEEAEVLGLLALAFLLATNEAERIVPSAVWSATVQPFASGTGYTVRSPLVRTTWRPTLDESACAAIDDWCRLLEERRHLRPGVHIAGNRLVSAVAGRSEPVDRLVDAVIAWENLVGADAETTFRVTGALAKLIEANTSERAPLASRLRAIYGLRSKAVHGADVDAKKLGDAADEAVRVGITALKRLYAKDSEWLMLGSTNRANRLLLEEP